MTIIFAPDLDNEGFEIPFDEHHPDFFAEVEPETEPHDLPFYSGRNYELHAAYYLGDDEVLDADELDQAAFMAWRDSED